MRIAPLLFSLLISALVVLNGMGAVNYPHQNTPYWVRPGTYLEYRAQSYHHPYSGGFYLLVNGTRVGITGSNITILFRVTSVARGVARVRVSFSINGNNNSPVRVLYPDNATFRPFWSNGSLLNTTRLPNNITEVLVRNFTPNIKYINATLFNTTKLPGNITRALLRNITITGEYMINLTSGWVYDMSGKPYGHTVLWDGFRSNETFALYNGEKVRIKEVRIANVSFSSYYSVFPKPNLIVKSDRVVGLSGSPRLFEAVYSPGYDVCISFIMDPIPDFNAVGVYDFLWTDEVASSKDMKLTEGREGLVNGVWPIGVILSKANLKSSNPTKVYPPGSSGLRYLPLLSLAGIGVVVFSRRGR